MASSTEKFAVARSRILAEFASLGWMVSNPNLKVPHATSLDRRHRFWLKPQAVYYSFGSNANDMHAAHSVTMDMRGWTADRLIRVTEMEPRGNPRRSGSKNPYSASRLTPDALPYRGYGTMTAREYTAHMRVLREIERDGRSTGWASGAAFGNSKDPMVYEAYMASFRAGLLESHPSASRGSAVRLSDYGHHYLSQRANVRSNPRQTRWK